MKTSISFLPEKKQEELRTIIHGICELLGDDCEMIILFGSYARNDYVDYDQRTEYGVRTYFMSDYDILVLTSGKESGFTVTRKLNRVEENFYQGRHHSMTTPIQFIQETFEYFNKAIRKGYYFYTDISKEGVLLYNSGRQKLSEPRTLNYEEIRDLSRQYFDERFKRANSFLADVYNAFNREDYKQASFYLHQAVENLYFAVTLTFSLYSPKEHNLFKISGYAKRHTLEVGKAFPRDTDEEQRLFQLLDDAYVQARYNPNFGVNREDVEALITKVELLRDITKEVCEERILEHEKMADTNNNTVEE
ncbi:HEPN domain-containing protein/predicted nucleotidyltransferase [Dysgonomonas sp. PFB1-18]|uniref:HEPN domain-containing protein n=1 Tax=unclassified Dysgonomonas TaxID=2630389 RepID=UPI0024764AB0|nr:MULTISPECIES: HEPN domain-containing protein [unclassified Dysgonomonas]MDH6308852.1 HEPN domain-containing protein/predicted nucleotidyltransferase [Dysgonomonas sp. PF1-14]MDH6338452.1 HEPN domain-containing protein/predicted nucleotidyltransferase [Dysgonomonas sp. PF1-16]MDH6380101.1 HEPN domain-containing protein/predicted nucleotidyltransferase [Dysgonomonas sp. PFB1-18]MDH6397280.1 HEPN domain-containing protein/predicted nucleotidyltransferase [Dysgonomonas sp. PF1-23]